jgi:gliding motility-associated-like protein
VLVYNDIYIPNSFTPDNNGLNDIFIIPPGTSLVLQSFSIYDRYGNEVFRTGNISEGWNGTYRGARCPMGAYAYIIKGSSRGMPVLLQGTVTIVR